VEGHEDERGRFDLLETVSEAKADNSVCFFGLAVVAVCLVLEALNEGDLLERDLQVFVLLALLRGACLVKVNRVKGENAVENSKAVRLVVEEHTKVSRTKGSVGRRLQGGRAGVGVIEEGREEVERRAYLVRFDFKLCPLCTSLVAVLVGTVYRLRRVNRVEGGRRSQPRWAKEEREGRGWGVQVARATL
jgi:hypothetical protein